MSTEESTLLNWSNDLVDSLWFRICNYLTVADIHRLARTCSRLHTLLNSNDFWSYLIRKKFGHAIWYRLIKTSSIFTDPISLSDSVNKACRSKLIYLNLTKRKQIAFSELTRFSFDINRTYTSTPDSSSLNGYVLHIKDSLELCYTLHIETVFKNILPGKYDVIWRMKLNLPYMLGATEFFAVAEQIHPSQMAYMRWTQEDFSLMYRCFYCDLTKTNLWFYQSIGFVEIHGDQPCDVYVSMVNYDSIHAKHGVYLDYVELKLCLE
ncbi:unnamed protein product [Adineta ricciae]|uniref:F-box domain-containing protein n=1 Tax=Adineta ricciae TaxID=249248 RepID=A0A816CGL9_ADIRI|nr:unnamed protein product [Adineta ricciae]CAF1623046.1 unnamed protein product [Adineta ricciae]